MEVKLSLRRMTELIRERVGSAKNLKGNKNLRKVTLCMNRPPRLTLDHVRQNNPNRRTENAGKRQATNLIGVTETDIEMIENHSSQHPQEQD